MRMCRRVCVDVHFSNKMVFLFGSGFYQFVLLGLEVYDVDSSSVKGLFQFSDFLI